MCQCMFGELIENFIFFNGYIWSCLLPGLFVDVEKLRRYKKPLEEEGNIMERGLNCLLMSTTTNAKILMGFFSNSLHRNMVNSILTYILLIHESNASNGSQIKDQAKNLWPKKILHIIG